MSEPHGRQPDPPPPETPGPSVSPPAQPRSDREREEWADGRVPDAASTQAGNPDEQLIAEQESAAIAEAREIGGAVPHSAEDPAMDPVYAAGGGEQDGWEQAEQDLIANATHADGRGDPLRDALTPEEETDRSTAIHGESDRTPSTAVRHDPGEVDDPMEGDPNLGADRGPNAPEDG
jgi:hypothetical protein